MASIENVESGMLADSFEPTGKIYWTGSTFIWVGGYKKKFALIKQSLGGRPTIIAQVGSLQSCNLIAEKFLFQGMANETISVAENDSSLKLTTVNDELKSIQDCKSRLARERERQESNGIHRISTLSYGYRKTAKKSSSTEHPLLLACRPSANYKTELIFKSNNDDFKFKTIDSPLALDNPVLQPDTLNGGWIAYPSFILERRKELSNLTPGIPVLFIDENFEVRNKWVPWGTWNLTGPYRFYASKKGLVCAVGAGWSKKESSTPGIYVETANGWAMAFPGKVDIASVGVGTEPDCIGWREQISLKKLFSDYGQFRFVSRIEQL